MGPTRELWVERKPKIMDQILDSVNMEIRFFVVTVTLSVSSLHFDSVPINHLSSTSSTPLIDHTENYQRLGV